MSEVKAEQNLALKVMRLTRPSLAMTSTVQPFGHSGTEPIESLLESPDFAFSSALVLPQSFGLVSRKTS